MDKEFSHFELRGGPTSGPDFSLLVDGVPLKKVKAFEFKGDIGEAWTVKLTMYGTFKIAADAKVAIHEVTELGDTIRKYEKTG